MTATNKTAEERAADILWDWFNERNHSFESDNRASIHQNDLVELELIFAQALQAADKEGYERGLVQGVKDAADFLENRVRAFKAQAGEGGESYPPCKMCGGPNDMAELCEKCAQGNDPFRQSKYRSTP